MISKREPLQTVEYFQGNIAERLEEIAKREGYLAQRAEQRMNWKAILLGLYSDYGRLLSCSYSIGSPVDELRPFIHESLKWGAAYFQEPDSDKGQYSDYFDIFYQAVSTLSWAILLSADDSVVLEYVRAIDKKMKPEPIVDYLMSYYQKDRAVSAKLAFPKAFEGLLMPVFSASKAEQPAIMKNYVAKWYAQVARKASWAVTHKPGQGTAFVGYWCWEAAALTILLGIDDAGYCDMKYYPKEFRGTQA